MATKVVDADDALVGRLVDMGFEPDRAATALAFLGNDLGQAVDWSFSSPPSSSSALPLPNLRSLPLSIFFFSLSKLYLFFL